MPKFYQQFVPAQAPPWMQGPNMGTLLEAIGAQLDARAQQVLDGRVLGNPYAGGATLADGSLIQCPPFALPIHAEQRGIPMYPTEPEAARRFRISQWLQLHRRRGTHLGEMQHLQPYWLPGTLPWIRIVFQDNTGAGNRALWHTLSPTGTYSIHQTFTSNWAWDSRSDLRTRFWVIVYWPPGYANVFNWDGGPTWDSGPIYDGVPAAVFADVWQLIYDWKSAHSWFAGLITTTLQPTDDIPGVPGVHPFDPASASTTNADGSTNLPIGNWFEISYSSGPNLGHHTRPPWATFYRVSNGW